MSDFIRIEGIHLAASVGVYPHEETMKQPISLDLVLGLALQKAGQTEDLDDTIDYDQVVETTKEVVSRRHYRLIETLAETLASTLKSRFAQLESVQVRLVKPLALLDAQRVMIEITR